MPGIMSAEIRSSFDMQWIRPVRAGCWMVAAVWNIAEDFSGIKRDLRIELRIRMQLVGLSAHASVGLWLTHIIEHSSCLAYGWKKRTSVGGWSVSLVNNDWHIHGVLPY